MLFAGARRGGSCADGAEQTNGACGTGGACGSRGADLRPRAGARASGAPSAARKRDREHLWQHSARDVSACGRVDTGGPGPALGAAATAAAAAFGC